jgi:uncharacterized protein YrrD
MDDYDGARVLDADGNAVGTVDRTYIDDRGRAQMVAVKMGSLFAKHRLVPVDQAQVTGDGLQVPYIKDVIEESPDVSSGDTVEGDVLDRVRSYYGGDYTGDGAAPGEDGAPSDTEDEHQT